STSLGRLQQCGLSFGVGEDLFLHQLRPVPELHGRCFYSDAGDLRRNQGWFCKLGDLGELRRAVRESTENTETLPGRAAFSFASSSVPAFWLRIRPPL